VRDFRAPEWFSGRRQIDCESMILFARTHEHDPNVFAPAPDDVYIFRDFIWHVRNALDKTNLSEVFRYLSESALLFKPGE